MLKYWYYYNSDITANSQSNNSNNIALFIDDIYILTCLNKVVFITRILQKIQ